MSFLVYYGLNGTKQSCMHQSDYQAKNGTLVAYIQIGIGLCHVLEVRL